VPVQVALKDTCGLYLSQDRSGDRNRQALMPRECEHMSLSLLFMLCARHFVAHPDSGRESLTNRTSQLPTNAWRNVLSRCIYFSGKAELPA
jgi:hypothetical protein